MTALKDGSSFLPTQHKAITPESPITERSINGSERKQIKITINFFILKIEYSMENPEKQGLHRKFLQSLLWIFLGFLFLCWILVMSVILMNKSVEVQIGSFDLRIKANSGLGSP